MFSLFKQFPEALENTRALADSVNLQIPMEDYHLPWYSIPGDKKSKDIDEYLKTLCSSGLKDKYENINSEINRGLIMSCQSLKKWDLQVTS